MNTELVLQAIITSALLSAVPLLLAALGEAIGERAGILNLGVEGTMLIGGFVGFRVALRADSIPLGLLVGAMVGVVVGFIFGVLVTQFQADQVVLGLGLTLVGIGLTGFLFREHFGSDQPLLQHTMGKPLDGWGDPVPVIGPAIFDQRWFVYLAWLITVAVGWLLTRSRLGLRLRAAGESPLALEAVGQSVTRTRILATSLAGLLQGLAGATLGLVELGFFSPGVTGGAGFLAIALTMIGNRNPFLIAAYAVGFGLLTGLDTGLQIANVDARPEFLQMIPYLGMVLALVIVGRNHRLPAALGVPWRSRREAS